MARPAPPTVDLALTPRLALRREDAAQALGVSLQTFDRHIRPELRCVRLGAVRAYPVSELQRYLDEHAVSPREEVAA